MAEIGYLKASSDGWWTALTELGRMAIPLPHYLQVEWTSTQNGRDYFTVKEGVHQGQKCSMKEGAVVKGSPGYKMAAELTFDVAKETLTFPGSKKLHAHTYLEAPIPKGRHGIQIPDFPHLAGSNYLAYSSFAQTWFYLGKGNATVSNGGDRYLHCGFMSAGCVTVDPFIWTELYKYLILRRSGNGKTVGTLIVV